jgi:adenylate cyclase
MHLKPKAKRNLKRILPFGIIWLVLGWVFLLAETAATGNQNMNPDTAITLTLPVFIFASIAVFIAGLLVGLIEVTLLEKRFRHYSLGAKITYKLLIYLLIMLAIISITYPIASSIEFGTGFSDPRIWKKMGQFFGSLVFFNTMVQMAFSLLISLIYTSISENLGHHVFLNFFTGKYHTAKIERRVFMFLDMKNSTSIAEKLGHVRYFDLLEMYYDVMSDSIINHYGEVYQYIGDEVVVSWPEDKGVRNNNCIACFQSIKGNMEAKRKVFMKRFGLCPDFKAGMHTGVVTTGEIGALKREIVFTGDVLNTTSRIQSLCKEYESDLLLSDQLLIKLPHKVNATHLGSIPLKGKNESIGINAVVL